MGGFQKNGFQNNGFQIAADTPPVPLDPPPPVFELPNRELLMRTPETATPAFRKAIDSASQNVLVRAWLVVGDQWLAELDIENGSVTCDGRRGVMRSLDLSVTPDEKLWPLLTTYGAEVRVFRGLRLPTHDELISLGCFVIDSDLVAQHQGAIQIPGGDRATRISRNRFIDPYQIPAGEDVGLALIGLLLNRWWQCPIGFGAIGRTTNAGVVFEAGAESDPWKSAQDFAEAHGHRLYFDAWGTAQLEPIIDPIDATPVATYRTGELSLVTDHSRKAAMGTVYNGVVASGEGSDVADAVKAVVWDDNPASPTYRYGPLGEVPLFYSSPLLTTYADCLAAARTRLANLRGRIDGMSWSLIVNPLLQPWDVIEFVDGGRTRHALDEITIPLELSDVMTASAREVARY